MLAKINVLFQSTKIWVNCRKQENEHKNYVQRFFTIFTIFYNAIIFLVEEYCFNLIVHVTINDRAFNCKPLLHISLSCMFHRFFNTPVHLHNT